MLLMIFIAGTILLSYVRGRAREPFWQAFGLEAGFLVAILHYGFFDRAFAASYTEFLIGWIAPVIASRRPVRAILAKLCVSRSTLRRARPI